MIFSMLQNGIYEYCSCFLKIILSGLSGLCLSGNPGNVSKKYPQHDYPLFCLFFLFLIMHVTFVCCSYSVCICCR